MVPALEIARTLLEKKSKNVSPRISLCCKMLFEGQLMRILIFLVAFECDVRIN